MIVLWSFLAVFSTATHPAAALTIRAGQHLGVEGQNFVYDGARVRWRS